jgi:putative endonuclease
MDTRRAGTSATTRDTGSRWEDAVLARAQRAGLALIARNFSCRYGEIDLIMRDRDQIVFIEVRYRGGHAQGGGTLSVGSSKRAKLVRTAALFLQQQPALAAEPCRFDVVGCSGSLAAPVFEWTRAAFEAV